MTIKDLLQRSHNGTIILSFMKNDGVVIILFNRRFDPELVIPAV